MDKLLAIVFLVAATSCEFIGATGDITEDPRWVALAADVDERSAAAETLMAENRALYDKIREEGVAPEVIASMASQLAANLEELARLANLQERAKAELEDLGEEYSVPSWQLYLAAAGSAIVGMGIPTSGPLAPILGGIAPLLERFGIRNRRRREDWHKDREA